MESDTDSCQICEVSTCSQRLSRTAITWYGLRWKYQHQGVLGIVATLLYRIADTIRPASAVRPGMPRVVCPCRPDYAFDPMGAPPPITTVSIKPSNGNVLDLLPGELVEVKSVEELSQILDAKGKTRGLSFMPGMQHYIGKQLRVLKRVELIRLENTSPIQVRKASRTVLLSGAFCEGCGVGCDRCCHFMWREEWLKRA
jgi:hypothetical protein